MRPALIEAALAQGLPAWIVPGYGALVGLAVLLSAVVVLRLTGREGGDVRTTATTILIAYAGALVGGYLYEWLRVAPDALFSGSLDPFWHVGRAAYGGLIFAAAAAAWHLRSRGASVLSFLDRAALVLGLVFFLVRIGCLLEGCDYGAPSELAFGVRYPADSLAAHHHAALGFVPHGAASLPTHPTQVYEGLVAIVGSVVALFAYRRTPPGVAFSGWLVTYAIGRALVEGLRADAGRGMYAGLSTAQWTSIALLSIVVVAAAARYAASRRTLREAV